MRVKIELLTSDIRAVLSCRLDISCSSPSQAAVAAAAAAAVPAAVADMAARGGGAAPGRKDAGEVGARDDHAGDLKSRGAEGKARIKGIPVTDTM